MRPARGNGNQSAQVAHHLAAVAHAQRETIDATEEGLELVARARIEQDRLGPTLPCAQHVPIGEAARRHEAAEPGKRYATSEDIARVHVDGIESGAVEGSRHLHLPVHTLPA